MDRNSIIGLVLIAGVLITFSIMNKPDDKPKKKKKDKQTEQTTPNISAERDTVEQEVESVDSNTVVLENNGPIVVEDSAHFQLAHTLVHGDTNNLKLDSLVRDSLVLAVYDSIHQEVVNKEEDAQLEAKYGQFSAATKGDNEIKLLENDHIRMEVSTKGAQIRRVELKQYRSYADYRAGKAAEKTPLVLMDSTNEFGFNVEAPDLSWGFSSRELYFSEVTKEDSKITLTAMGDDSRLSISYEITDDYEVKMNITSEGLDPNSGFSNLVWEMKARSLEKSRWQENQVAGLFYKYENDSRDYLSEGSNDSEKIEAAVEWVAFKQSFFSAILMPKESFESGGKFEHWVLNKGEYMKKYRVKIKNPNFRPNQANELVWYFGPNDYSNLDAYDIGLHKLVNHGWAIFGWINRNFFLPLYQWLDGMGMNHGLIIFLMTIIIRLITMPLVFRNYRSSAKMRLLKPEIEEIGKKFPDQKDSMKKQQATMALYRSTGVNPLAGCVPMLIQMPILFAMFRLVPTLTELRQESFLWADDLSSYDAIVTWSQHIPLLSDFYGNHISLFTLLMAGATLAYTLINMNQVTPTQPGMPNMKFIMYLFPIMMIFFFNRYSSGLSYYYFLSSLLSMGIMFIIKRYFIDEEKLRVQIQENKKKPKKKSRFQQRLEDMQAQQAKKKK